MRLTKALKKLLLPVLMLSCLVRPEEQLSPKLQKYLVETHRYFLNAPWLIEEFMAMNLHEFSASWAYLVSLMKNPQERWRFFCDKQEDYKEATYRAKWIWQCHFFELWMSKLYVRIEDLSLAYDRNGTLKSDKAYAHIYGCWRTLMEHGQGDFSAIYDFYAFFADMLVASILTGEKIASLELDTPVYDAAWQVSFSLVEGLKIMAKMLQDSDYAQRYGAQLQRYMQVLDLLKQEKIRFFAG